MTTLYTIKNKTNGQYLRYAYISKWHGATVSWHYAPKYISHRTVQSYLKSLSLLPDGMPDIVIEEYHKQITKVREMDMLSMMSKATKKKVMGALDPTHIVRMKQGKA